MPMRARHGPGFGLPFQALPATDKSTSNWSRERREIRWLWPNDSGGDRMTNVTGNEEEEYLYEQSGIRERHGAVPLWLKLVVTGLLLWGVYYMIQYWSVW